MIFDKNKTKKYLICMTCFVVGMLSVSISNIFGGYYASVAAIEVVVSTMLMNYVMEEKESLKDNIIELSLVGIITFLGILFFIVNDIFGVSVYVKNNLNFWGVVVIISQLLSVCAICYSSVCFVLKSNKDKIEVVETNDNGSTLDNNNVLEENEEKVEEEIKKEENKPEIKSITEADFDTKTPFMEEDD